MCYCTSLTNTDATDSGPKPSFNRPAIFGVPFWHQGLIQRSAPEDYYRVINMINGKKNHKRPYEEERSSLTEELIFLTVPQYSLTDEPIILEGITEGNQIRRIHVDSGSSSKIMYEHCFKSFGANIWLRLRRYKTPLVGFSEEELASLIGYPYKCFLLPKENSQIRMVENNKEKTGFHTEEGVYCFTHMSKGLKKLSNNTSKNGGKEKQAEKVWAWALLGLDEKMYSYAIRLNFDAPNHIMDYEALLAGLVASAGKGIKDLLVFIDSKVLVDHMEGGRTQATKEARKYMEEIIDATVPFYRRQNKRRTLNVVEPELCTIVEVAPMADNRTMEELLQAPTKGYGEA
nr:reverse transcriptase domain-containing protein [Tanacetum cinerariifolium]